MSTRSDYRRRVGALQTCHGVGWVDRWYGVIVLAAFVVAFLVAFFAFDATRDPVEGPRILQPFTDGESTPVTTEVEP